MGFVEILREAKKKESDPLSALVSAVIIASSDGRTVQEDSTIVPVSQHIPVIEEKSESLIEVAATPANESAQQMQSSTAASIATIELPPASLNAELEDPRLNVSPVAAGQSAGAASIANVGPSAPLHRAPVDQEPKPRQAFIPDGSGNVTIDVTAMVTDTPVDTPLVNATPVMGVTTPVGIPTPKPQVGANQAPTVQPQVRLRRDRGDMQDMNIPKSDMPAGGILMDKSIILQQYPAFKLIEDKLDPSQFESIYRNDGIFIYVDIYPVGKDKTPENRIDWMSMTVDASGHIYGGGVAKFWPGSDNKEPVDFMPALHFTPEAIEAYWNGEKPIPQQHYYAVATTAELNRKIDISSIFFNDFNVKDAPAVIKTLTEVAKNTKVNSKLKDGRLRMFSYKSPKEFVLIADDKVFKYVGGPKANSDIQSFTVSISNGKVAAVV